MSSSERPVLLPVFVKADCVDRLKTPEFKEETVWPVAFVYMTAAPLLPAVH